MTSTYRRRVVECAEGYRVDPGDFTTTDHVLAVAVARQLDRDDPLPCEHDGDRVELPEMGLHPDDWSSLCQQCGRLVRPGAP